MTSSKLFNLLEQPVKSLADVKKLTHSVSRALREVGCPVPLSKLQEAVARLCGARNANELRRDFQSPPRIRDMRLVPLPKHYGPTSGLLVELRAQATVLNHDSREVAAACGVSLGDLFQLFNGAREAHRLSDETMAAIARYLGSSVDRVRQLAAERVEPLER